MPGAQDDQVAAIGPRGVHPAIVEEVALLGQLQHGEFALEPLQTAAVDDLVGVGQQDQIVRRTEALEGGDGLVALVVLPRPCRRDMIGGR